MPLIKASAFDHCSSSLSQASLKDTAFFFGTQGTDSCWADITRQDLLDAARYDIAGEVYCIAPLNEINGDSSTTIVELSFATQVDWDLT